MVETEYKLVPAKENDYQEKKEDLPPASYGYGVRHIQGLLFFISLSISYASRAHLGVTIVAMTMNSDINIITNNDVDAILKVLKEANATLNITDYTNIKYNATESLTQIADDDRWNVYRTYDWPKSTQEMVLGAFFLGYCVMMFPFGLVCQRWGGKIPLQISLIVSAITCFLAPWIVVWGGWKTLCACRLLQGFSQAGLYPALTTLLSNWVPIQERASLNSYVLTGSGFGTIAAFQIGGVLAFSRFGWPSTFWVMGVISFVGFTLITVYGAATPNEHRSISEKEKNYITGSISQRVTTKSQTPWKAICTSVPAWATFAAHVGSAVCFVFFFTQVPTYMSAILKMNIRNSGLLASLPYIASFFTCIAFGYLSDFCTNRKILSIKTARILSNSIASVIPALILTFVSYTRNTALAVACFVLALASHAAMHTGWMVNYIDLSPNYSGALMAFGNTLANVFVVILPIVVANIVTDVTNPIQWRVMMFLVAGVNFGLSAIFVFFISADIQPWNDMDNENTAKDTEETKLELEKTNLNKDKIK